MKYSPLLEAILRPGSLRAEFQPVVDLSAMNSPSCYWEGLIRGPAGTNVERPDVLFSYARRKRAEVEVDRACLRTVLTAARQLPGVAIGVNVHAATLAADLELLPFLSDVLTETGLKPEDVVLELVEHGQAWDRSALRRSLEGIRSIGLRVALDDFGVGRANHLMLLECRPEFLKIDRHFIHGCHADPARQALVEGLAAMARRLGAEVIAEGVEDPLDLEELRSVGIKLVQGHLLGRPAPPGTWQHQPCA
jgi:EAL domain-containing protein (putative c-di-GMP-specific phosphodiesterase class I)